MQDAKLMLAALWLVVMLIYLLGDVLRIFKGDFVSGEIEGRPITQGMWLGVAAMMLVPILMIFFSLTLGYQVNRWANIIVAGIFFVFNFAGVPSYPGLYDRFLLVVSLIFNVLTIWAAWNWVEAVV